MVDIVELNEENIKTEVLDHHGLVAAVCQDLRIAERIDQKLPPDSQRRVSSGTAVVALIINGLGFTNRRLYLTHQFFRSKPIETLLGKNIKAEDLTDYTLGHTLDDIAKYGASKLFAETAFSIALEHDLLGGKNHIDTSSLSVHGTYEVDDNPKEIEVCHGYSKDHRPDLKQVVLSLVVNGPAGIPIWMDALDGNSSDKTSFHETIKKMKDFRSQIELKSDFKWIADSALYTKDKLLKSNDYIWVTRVPETIAEAKTFIRKDDDEIDWVEREKGYKTAAFSSLYGGIEQRWLMVFSEQAYNRERKTLEKKIKKEEKQISKELRCLERQQFYCKEDGMSVFKKLCKSYAFHRINHKVTPIKKHKSRGKPKAGAEQIIVGYRLQTECVRDEERINKSLNRKGRFILATNELDRESYKDETILEEYKEQQSVERGFRFLKDPWFMVDSVFLKLPRRIEALMMIMTLCLLVYNLAQYKLRQNLKEANTTLPNQLGKEIRNPTLRWIFQLMEGVGLVRFYCQSLVGPVREIVTNVNNVRKKIISMFGTTACRIYGLIRKRPAEGLGM